MFDSDYLIVAVVSGKYEQNVAAGWSEGDWNGDVRFDSEDLMVALEDGGYDQPTAARPVPEPSTLMLALLLAAPFAPSALRRKRRGR